jgi:aconitate decarboxylase
MTSANPSNPSKPSNPAGATGKLSNWIHSTNLSTVPAQVVTRAKYLILDGVACALIGSHLPWSTIAAKSIFNMEPKGSCTVVGWGDKKLSPLAAAILNSTFIQGFELDDYHSVAPLHSNSLLLPALLSAAEMPTHAGDVPKMYSGSDVLLAYIIGCEVGPRVGLALHGADLLSRGWHSGAVQGPSASAAAVSSLLHLPPNQVEDALGIACTQAGGLMSAQFGSMAKRMQHGFASRNGLYAALLAQGGYTGIHEVYETPYGGFLSCFGQGANFQPPYLPDELVKGLGEKWEIDNIRVKLHASMAALHGTIDCVANLQRKHGDRMKAFDDIESIVTEHSKPAFEHGGWIAPPDKPLTTTSAQMSIQYAAAAQLVDEQVLMGQFGAEKLNRPLLRELMAKITPNQNKELDRNEGLGMSWQTNMTVKFRDGTELKKSVKAPRGIEPAVSNEEIVDKWRRLVDGILDVERREQIEKCVMGLEQLEDVRELCGLLAGVVKSPIQA